MKITFLLVCADCERKTVSVQIPISIDPGQTVVASEVSAVSSLLAAILPPMLERTWRESGGCGHDHVELKMVTGPE